MRAILYPFTKESVQKNLFITGESAKHLHVVRVKREEKILVLNGHGLKVSAKVGEISKNQIELLIESVEEVLSTHEISLAIATPKKDAFEDILKIAVELGVRNIYPLTSEFSQFNYSASERIQRILESALVQSNNPFLPTIHPQVNLDHFLTQLKIPLYFFNSRASSSQNAEKVPGKKMVLIGPEGGFSLREEASILTKLNVFSIHFRTPILRASTAVASSVGYLLSHD